MSYRLKVKTNKKQNLQEVDPGSAMLIGGLAGSIMGMFVGYLGLKQKNRQTKLLNNALEEAGINPRNETGALETIQKNPQKVADILHQQGIDVSAEQVENAAQKTAAAAAKVNTSQTASSSDQATSGTASAGTFDSSSSYYEQPDNQVNILKPLVRAWNTSPEIQALKKKGVKIQDLSELYIEKFEESVKAKQGINLEDLVKQTIEAIKVQKGAQTKPAEDKPATAETAPEPAQVTAEPASAPAPAQAEPPKEKEVSEFFQKLNMLKKAYKLTPEHVKAIKNLNTKFMRASHQLSEAKTSSAQEEKQKKQTFGREYIKQKIAEVVGAFKDFDDVEKANLTKALNKIFLELYVSKKAQQQVPAATQQARVSTQQAAPTTQPASAQPASTALPSGDEGYEIESSEPMFQQFYDEVAKALDPAEKQIADVAFQKIKTHVDASNIDPNTGQYKGQRLNPRTVSASIKDAANEVAKSAQAASDNTVLSKLTAAVAGALQKAGIIDQQGAEEVLNEIKKSNKTLVYEGLFQKFTTNKQPNNSKQLFTFDGNRFKKYNRG